MKQWSLLIRAGVKPRSATRKSTAIRPGFRSASLEAIIFRGFGFRAVQGLGYNHPKPSRGPALNIRNPFRFQGQPLTEVSDYPQDVLCRGIAPRTIRGMRVFRPLDFQEFRVHRVLSFGGCESLEPEALQLKTRTTDS